MEIDCTPSQRTRDPIRKVLGLVSEGEIACVFAPNHPKEKNLKFAKAGTQRTRVCRTRLFKTVNCKNNFRNSKAHPVRMH